MKLMNLESMYHDFLRQFQAKERSNDNVPTNCELIGFVPHLQMPQRWRPGWRLISGVSFFLCFFGVDTVFFSFPGEDLIQEVG